VCTNWNQPSFGEETATLAPVRAQRDGPDHWAFDGNAFSGDTPRVFSQTRRPGTSDQTPLPARRSDTQNIVVPGLVRPWERNNGAAQPIAISAMTARQKAQNKNSMMNRSTTTSVTGRASAMRRMRRRTGATMANSRLFCGTNGCPSFLEMDPTTGIATCHICGFVRRIH